MFLWRKTAELHWIAAHEDRLETRARGRLVIVRRPGRKRLELEIVSRRRNDLSVVLEEFGGRIETLPRNWLERFTRSDSKPIKIGKRLLIWNSEETSGSLRSQNKDRSQIIIPASLAFGTGDHATTAMSLRFLEQLTRDWKSGWSLLDLGTGSGVLCLAGKCFGAGSVVGIDNDPTAISVAKSNARLNKTRGVMFQLGDARKWRSTQSTDLITANLYSDLLMEILPKLGRARWLILSGILRSQLVELLYALRRNHDDVIEMKRRGKWVAILARRRQPPSEAK